MGLILERDLDNLKEYFRQKGEPEYRAKQVWNWIFSQKILDFSSMSNLPLRVRSFLEVDFSSIKLIQVNVSKDGTEKYLWDMDGELVESVLLHYQTSQGAWLSACVSTQVGCPIGCSFCATGKSGFRRNLTCGEIIAQVVGMEKESGQNVSRVLFMGMGEPVLNWDDVLRAIKIMESKEALALSGRRITISTVGPPQIEKVLSSGIRTELAYSLHSAWPDKRKELIGHELYPANKTLNLLRKYQKEAGRRVTIEYLMLEGLNDSPKDAQRLGQILKKDFFVNLIPYNRVEGVVYFSPPPEKIRKFAQILRQMGIKVGIRKPQGEDIAAACGQLRHRHLDKGKELIKNKA